jgi:hypothetical protein
LCYFQLLQAVKDSEFLNADLLPLTSSSAPLTLRRIGSKWIGVGDGSSSALDTQSYLQPVIVSLDAFPSRATAKNESINQTPVLQAIDALDHSLRQETTVFESGSLRFDPDLCFRSQKQCFTTSYKDGDAHFATSRSTVLTYAFAHGTDDAQAEWLKKLPGSVEALPGQATFTVVDSHRPHMPLSSSAAGNDSTRSTRGLGISLPLSPRTQTDTTGRYEPALRQMTNVSWVFYAFKAFVMRFWTLAKVR